MAAHIMFVDNDDDTGEEYTVVFACGNPDTEHTGECTPRDDDEAFRAILKEAGFGV